MIVRSILADRCIAWKSRQHIFEYRPRNTLERPVTPGRETVLFCCKKVAARSAEVWELGHVPERGLIPMKIDERALLQERVRTLVLRHALEAVLERLAAATRDLGKDAEAEFLNLEQSLVSAARSIADRASAQKLAVLVAVEDASTTIRAAFDNAHDRLEALRPAQPAHLEPPAAVAA